MFKSEQIEILKEGLRMVVINRVQRFMAGEGTRQELTAIMMELRELETELSADAGPKRDPLCTCSGEHDSRTAPSCPASEPRKQDNRPFYLQLWKSKFSGYYLRYSSKENGPYVNLFAIANMQANEMHADGWPIEQEL